MGLIEKIKDLFKKKTFDIAEETLKVEDEEYEVTYQRVTQIMSHGNMNNGSYCDEVDVLLWKPEFNGVNVTILCDRLVMDDLHQHKYGRLFLHTDLNCISILNIEQQSSGFKMITPIEDDSAFVALEISPSNIKDELIIPDKPRTGFKWGSYISVKTSHLVPTSRYGHRFILNFSVSGEFDIDIYYYCEGMKAPKCIFEKSFCCK